MVSSVDNRAQYKILGVRVDECLQSDVVDGIIDAVGSSTTRVVYTINPEIVAAASKRPWFRDALNASDWSVIDGIGIRWALLFRRRRSCVSRALVPAIWLLSLFEFAIRSLFTPGRVGPRVTGSDLLPALFSSLPPMTRVYALGGNPTSVSNLRKVLQTNYPHIQWVGIEHGPAPIVVGNHGIHYPRTQDDPLSQRVRQSRAQIVIVGFGQIKQELWIAQHRDCFPEVKALIGVGGALDFLSRPSLRSPATAHQRGLEWFWRLMVEPYRFQRIIIATIVFPFMVLREQLRRKKE